MDFVVDVVAFEDSQMRSTFARELLQDPCLVFARLLASRAPLMR